MKTKKPTLFLLFLLITQSLMAQDDNPVYVGFETGFYNFESMFKKMDFIREGASEYDYWGDYTNDLEGSFASYYAGVKLEKDVLKNRLSVITGLRFSRFTTHLGDTDSSEGAFMYLLYSEDGTTTEFLKANGIIQRSDYLGVPLEVKFFPKHKHLPFRSYFKLGAVVNFHLLSQNEIVFSSTTMDQYEDGMAKRIKDPDSFNSIAYAAVGFQIGVEDKPFVTIELNCPTFTLTPDAFTFTRPDFGVGLQFSFHVPINANLK